MELKYFKEFNTKSDYDTYINGDPILPNVSFVNQDVYYEDGNTPPPIISAGMICYHDGSSFKFCTSDEWSASLGEVQGVVVVPSNHTIDGTARIMCIDGVNTDGSHGDDGEQEMEWGPRNIDIWLRNLNQVPTWDNTIGGAIGNNVYGRLPSTSKDGDFTGATCATDSIAKYAGFTPYIPSPYLEDGSLNSDYINTVKVPNNALSDFNGKYNTSVLVGLGTAYTAANACHQYGTTALPAGNWYLPAMGELGYIISRYNEINTALVALKGYGGTELYGQRTYWSSTEYSDFGALAVETFVGDVKYMYKYSEYYVRAFASVPVE